MNNISKIINKIYSNMLRIILNDIESDYHEVASKKYMETLMNRYSNIAVDSDSMEEAYNYLYQLEYNEWKVMPIGVKKNILIKDSALNKIIDLSSFAFKCAEDRLVNNIFITKQLCDECILKFNDLYNDVKSFNKNLAMWYVSQATVDLTYASNQTDGMSDRVSHIKN